MTHMTLLTKNKISSIFSHCIKNPNGLMAEVGVFNGGFVQILSDAFPDAKIYAYDTFEGMPKSCWRTGEVHRVGEFKPCNDVIKALSNKKNVIVKKGIFPNTIGNENGFWMVHLDVDFYISTLNSLKVLIHRMSRGGAIFLDDWGWQNCPGVKQAAEDLGLKTVQTSEHQAAIYF